MNMKSIFDQFGNNSNPANSNSSGISDTLGKISSQLPSGLAGGAVAGGIMSLIMSNKSARKFAGTAATYGGAALLGGLAYKAYKNWQAAQDEQPVLANGLPDHQLTQNQFVSTDLLSSDYQLKLIKVMVGAAQADGHIDAEEQQRIFQSIDKMDLSMETKAMVLDLLRQPVSITDIADGITSMEQKTELYLVACMIIDPDLQSEKQWLSNLATALSVPNDLAMQLEMQARQHLLAA